MLKEDALPYTEGEDATAVKGSSKSSKVKQRAT
jgi:hypothetical protein